MIDESSPTEEGHAEEDGAGAVSEGAGDTSEPTVAPDGGVGPEEPPAAAAAAESSSAEAAAAAKRRRRAGAVIRAFKSGSPVDGRVDRVIKGGYEVFVGKTRAFCPHSQMDIERVENPDVHVGQIHKFRVIQVRRGGDDVVVSRRALLEEERGEEAKAVRATLIHGAVMQGRVVRLAEFGAFVDLGAGVTGLVHVSELSHGRVARVDEALKPGDRVSVKILKLDEATGRISLSIRQAQSDPWTYVADRFRPGDVVDGRVVRQADFGAFVEIAPGIEALAPAREMPPTAADWRSTFNTGFEGRWQVLAVEAGRRRIAVIPAPPEGVWPAEITASKGERIRGRVQRAERFGVFVWLGPGHVALIPSAWTGTPKGTDLSSQFPVGQEIEAELVDVSEGGRRIRLTLDAAAVERAQAEAARRDAARGAATAGDEEPRRDAKPAASEPAAAPAASFGTSLGDALRSALEKNRSSER